MSALTLSGIVLGLLGGCCTSLAIEAHRMGLSWWKEAFFGFGFMFAGIILVVISEVS